MPKSDEELLADLKHNAQRLRELLELVPESKPVIALEIIMLIRAADLYCGEEISAKLDEEDLEKYRLLLGLCILCGEPRAESSDLCEKCGAKIDQTLTDDWSGDDES